MKEGLKIFLIAGLADDLVKIYDPITSLTRKEKSEQVCRTSLPIPDLFLLPQDLPIQEYDPEIGTGKGDLIDTYNWVLAAFHELLKTVLYTSEEKETKEFGDEEGDRDDLIPSSPSSRTTWCPMELSPKRKVPQRCNPYWTRSRKKNNSLWERKRSPSTWSWRFQTSSRPKEKTRNPVHWNIYKSIWSKKWRYPRLYRMQHLSARVSLLPLPRWWSPDLKEERRGCVLITEA